MIRFFEHEDVKCIRLLRRALQIDNSFVPALVVMGELERSTLRSAIAQNYFKRALKYDQHQQIALRRLVEMNCDSGSTEEAWKHYQVVKKLNSELASPEIGLFDDADLKLTLASRVRQSGPVCWIKELFFDTPWQVPVSPKPPTIEKIIRPEPLRRNLRGRNAIYKRIKKI